MHNLELLDNIFVRDNLIDDPGTFWYFEPDATKNDMRQPSHRDTRALVIKGNNNRIMNNVITNCTAAAIHIIGDGNILLNNIVDNDVIIEGKNNQIHGLVFSNPMARLFINGQEVSP